MRRLRNILALAAVGLAGVAAAGPVEDGFSAYRSGDYARALQIWRPYAENGDRAAQALLGDLYYAGQGVAQDYKQALYWFKLAAAKGDVAAEYNLGLAAEQGRGQPASAVQALDWYKKAADAGHVPSRWRWRGFPAAATSRDPAAAALWTEKAAKTGDPQAQDELAALYRIGSGRASQTSPRRANGTARRPSRAMRRRRTTLA